MGLPSIRRLQGPPQSQQGLRSPTHLAVRNAGKGVQSTYRDIERLNARLLQRLHLRLNSFRPEFIGQRRTQAGKTAQAERDVRLAHVAIEQQVGQVRLRGTHTCRQRAAIKLQRPQGIGRTPHVPLDKVSAFIAQGGFRGRFGKAGHGAMVAAVLRLTALPIHLGKPQATIVAFCQQRVVSTRDMALPEP